MRFSWFKHPDVEQQFMHYVGERLKAGHSRSTVFEDASKMVSSKLGVAVSPHACEVKYSRMLEKPPVVPSRPRLNAQVKLEASRRVEQLIRRGLSANAAYKRVAADMRVTPGAVRHAHRTPTRMSPAKEPTRHAEDELLTAVSNFARYGRLIQNFDLTSFVSSLAALAQGAANQGELEKEAARVQQLSQEVESLRAQLQSSQSAYEQLNRDFSELRSKAQEYETYRQRMQEAWDGLKFTVGEWLAAESADRLIQFPRVFQRLKVTVDQFGTVLSATPEFVEPEAAKQ